jgi:hypothetical protein
MPLEPRTTLEDFHWRGITCRLALTRNHRVVGWTLIRLRSSIPCARPYRLRPMACAHMALRRKSCKPPEVFSRSLLPGPTERCAHPNT